MQKYSLNMLLVVFAVGLLFAAHFRIIDGYIQIVVMTMLFGATGISAAIYITLEQRSFKS